MEHAIIPTLMTQMFRTGSGSARGGNGNHNVAESKPICSIGHEREGGVGCVEAASDDGNPPRERWPHGVDGRRFAGQVVKERQFPPERNRGEATE